MQFTMKHAAISVLDLERSLAFYERALGMRLIRRIDAPDGSRSFAFLAGEGSQNQLELSWSAGRTEPYSNGAGEVHAGFAVADIEAARAFHEEQGFDVRADEELGVYYLTDPDGFLIEIIPA